MCYNSTVCFKIRVIKFIFYCNSIIAEPLPNFQSKFSQKEEVGSYNNIALNQRYILVEDRVIPRCIDLGDTIPS